MERIIYEGREKMTLDDKISDAMHRIEDLYYQTEGKCYVSFSGGKDSTVILAIIKMCEEIYTIPQGGIKAVFCDTGIELGATRDFVRWCRDNWYSNVEIIRPEKTFSWILANKGKPMKSKMKSEIINRYQRNKNTNEEVAGKCFDRLMSRELNGKPNKKTRIADKDLHIMHDDFDIQISNSCCDILKKKPFSQWQKENDMQGYLLGLRTGEGGVREIEAIKRVKNGGKLCTATKGKWTIKMPIIDWTDDDVEEFIQKYNIPLSKAYTEYGMKRTGCMGCPYALNIAKDLEVLWNYEPQRYKASMFFLKDVYIAQNVQLPFDEEYEKERNKKWNEVYKNMRNEMLLKYRPKSKLCVTEEQTSIFDFL